MFRSALGALLSTFFGMIGIAAGIIVLILIFAAFTSNNTEEVTPHYKTKVLFNPDGTKTTLKSNTPLILQINIDGVIGMGGATVDKMRILLDESQTNPIAKGRIKGIFLNVNSPGGGAFDSDAIYRLLMEYKKKYDIPIYTYTEHVLASGGYYIGVAGDKIYSSPVGIIGSVGVLVPTVFNIHKLLQKFDIETLTISDGKFKDALNPLRPWTPEDKEYLKPMIDYFYEVFLTVVSERRPLLTKETLINVTGARVYAPVEAQKLGYIDEIVPTQSVALYDLVKETHLEGTKYQVVTLEENNWWTELFSEDVSNAFKPFQVLFYALGKVGSSVF